MHTKETGRATVPPKHQLRRDIRRRNQKERFDHLGRWPADGLPIDPEQEQGRKQQRADAVAEPPRQPDVARRGGAEQPLCRQTRRPDAGGNDRRGESNERREHEDPTRLMQRLQSASR